MRMSPCKGCTDRHDLCHSTCEKYREYKRVMDDEKKLSYRNKQTEVAINAAHHHRAVTRRKK